MSETGLAFLTAVFGDIDRNFERRLDHERAAADRPPASLLSRSSQAVFAVTFRDQDVHRCRDGLVHRDGHADRVTQDLERLGRAHGLEVERHTLAEAVLGQGRAGDGKREQARAATR